jgi:hypothetical protein
MRACNEFWGPAAKTYGFRIRIYTITYVTYVYIRMPFSQTYVLAHPYTFVLTAYITSNGVGQPACVH